MPATTKTTTTTMTTKDKDRRKSASKTSLVTLKVSPDRLRRLLNPAAAAAAAAATPTKEESPSKESPADTATLPTEPVVAPSNGDNASSSNPGTPAAAAGTPSQVPMGPPTEGLKKKGVKRGANGAEPKARGKPGPKKKPRLEDGTIDPNAKSNAGAYHKLGPKANQGAINAGLRALDRSGKPCRKWQKGGFRLKTFTGVVWEIPRWAAPPKPSPDATQEASTVSTDSSNKENNKEDSQMKSENSASGADGDQRSLPPSLPAASSPAPMPVAAAS